ncbi:RNA polymerase sigma factor [Streptomyces daliensis]
MEDQPPARGEAPPPSRLDEADDSLLAVRAGEGDEEAFEVLVRRHAPVLVQMAHRLLGGKGDAEDAVQEAFVNAWRRLPEFRGDAAFRTWMYRIVTNKCLSALRSHRPSAPLDAVAEPVAPDHASSPTRAAEGAAAVEELARALGELTPRTRACWVLRELHGLSYADIAEAVGVSPQSVRGRIFRARRYLTEAMGAWR